MWQEEQVVGIAVYRPLIWHCEQATFACAPLNGHPVIAWLKFTFIHELVLWQVAQLVGKPALM